jgi:hypothetical protein
MIIIYKNIPLGAVASVRRICQVASGIQFLPCRQHRLFTHSVASTANLEDPELQVAAQECPQASP